MNVVIPLIVLAACVVASRWFERKISQHLDPDHSDGDPS